MTASPYFAQYCTFIALSKERGGYLLSADNLVGDMFEITFEMQEGQQVAALFNKFGYKVGFLDGKITHKLLLCKADGWELHAALSAVFFSEHKDGGYYWGEVAVMCFSRRNSESFTLFMEGICKELRKGRRPSINLKPQGVNTVIESKGNWVPKDKEEKRKLPSGTVVVKDMLKYDETLIEMARNKNIGCMIIGWAFIIALIALGIYMIWDFIPFIQ